MEVTLTHVTENPITAIEEAACNCYDSKPTGGKIMKACYNSGHHSVLEFANFTFHITGVSRALLAQLTRHRHAGFAVRSQRYCTEDNFDYVTPHSIESNKEALVKYRLLMSKCRKIYEELQSLGISNEDARYILPNACCTTLEFTCNGRELIHVCNERLCTRAQWEIRELVSKMKECVKNYNKECSEFSELLQPKCGRLHYCPEHKSCGREPKLSQLLDSYNKLKNLNI